MLKLNFEKAEIETRNQLVNQFLVFMAFLSSIIVSASLYRATAIGWQPFMYIHLMAGLLGIVLALFRDRIPYLVKAWLIVVLLLLVGLYGFYTLGIITSGHAFILMSVTAATAFLSTRAGIGFALIAMISLSALSVLWINHKAINFDPYYYLASPQSWVLLITSLAAMTAMSMMVTGRLAQMTRNFLLEAVTKADTLAINEARTEAFLQSAVDQALIATDNNGIIIRWNFGAETMFGFTNQEAMGRSLFELILPPQLPSFERKKSSLFKQLVGSSRSSVPLKAKRKNGSFFDSTWVLGRWFEEENEYHSIIITDISERIAYEEKLYQQAHYDNTTHLLNRTGLIESIDARLGKESSIALLLINFSGLSDTNTSHGYLIGDRLIAVVGKKVKSITTKQETLARLSACQFALIIEHDVHERAHRIQTQLDALFSYPTQVDHLAIHQEITYGMALSEKEDLDAHSLLSKAFVALSQAKQLAPDHFALYSPDYNLEAQQQSTLLSELHDAIQNGEFELFFQPQVDAKTGQCHGLEGLIRWNHPTRGRLLPNEFIGWAESSNLILPLGDWALEEGCRAARKLIDLGYSEITVAINISPKQLYLEDLIGTVERLITQYQLPKHALEIEVTESLLVSNVHNLHDKFQSLHNLGVLIGMDDFGTGYSSLSYLQSISFDTLKIDKSFIEQVPKSSKATKILKAIIDMSKALGLNVVTEGVETKEQAEVVAKLGGNLIQGYVNAKPMPFKVLVNWLEKNRLGR